MSLLMPRMPAAAAPKERASVVLPTVKCSSCAINIPLNSLGEHVCRPTMNIPPIYTNEPSPPLRQRPFVPSPGLQRPNAPGALRPPAANGFLVGDVVRFGGDYPADVPLSAVSETSMRLWPMADAEPAGHVLPSPTLPDTTSGGFAGMAGVGRRAFAAAAWSVRAGVGLAASVSANDSSYGSSPEGDRIEMPVPSVGSQSTERAPSPPLDRSKSGRTNNHNRSPTLREPVILPKAPLSGRQRTNTIRDPSRQKDEFRSGSRADDYRSASRADDYRSASRADERSGSRAEVYRAGSRAGDHRAQSRADDHRPPRPHPNEGRSISAQSVRRQGDDRNPFFERYRAAMGSKSDQTHQSSSTRLAYDNDDESEYDSGDDVSQLPWASSPDEEAMNRFDHHQRNPTDGSIESMPSSADPQSGSGHEMELVMTPNQSWEGPVDRSVHLDGKGGYAENPGLGFSDGLAEIGEEDEDEGERLVFGQNNRRSLRKAQNLSRSNSESTVVGQNRQNRALDPPRLPLQMRSHEMDPPRMGLAASGPRDQQNNSSRSSPTDGRRPKRSCVSCGEAVGGSRRFVERDGIVLCEADWKKLYLPSCRRCKNPIEKSAVSSSDGQLKGKWHRTCFTCTRCDQPFDGDDFYVHDGRPWCQHHYAEENGTLCAANSCGKAIEGPCILAPGSNGSSDQRFHPGHLRCEHRGGASGAQNCRESMREYYEVGGSRYCERHANEAVRRHASSGGHRAEKRRTLLVDLSNGLAPKVDRI